MTPSDFTAIGIWWIYTFLIGIAFLPITMYFFQIFFDKGYAFSKIFGIIITTYLMLLFGTLHIFPFQKVVIIGIIGTAFLVNYLSIFRQKKFHLLRKNIYIFIFEELLFITGLIFWAYIRSFQPDIHGLEKYMDFGFVNSILRSTYFPPRDMWFTPHTINYYYFGHLITAMLTKLSSLPSAITFNLMIASLFSLTFVCAFSLGGNFFYLSFFNTKIKENKINFYKKMLKIFFLPGILSAALLTFAGNLHTLYAFFLPYQNDYPKPFWQLRFFPSSFPNSYWYPNATRFIYHTIHEFPIYSFVVSDLHGHVLDIPIVLTTVALSLIFFIKPDNHNKVSNLKSDLIGLKFLVLLSFMLAIMYMTNAWDGIIYFLLIGSILLYKGWQRKEKVFHILGHVLFLFAGFFVFSLPFSFFFKPFVSNIGVLCAPEFLTNLDHIGPFLFEANHCQTSPLWQLFILYGFFYFFVICFLFFLWRRKKLLPSDIFVLLLIFLSTVLILIPEFIYVKDIYPTYYRANTMFKLVYQSFIMLSISSGYIIIRIGKNFRNYIFWIVTLPLLFLVFLYPNFAIPSYYGNLQKHYGLDGMKYLSVLYSSDYQAILWINKTISGHPVILEAQGDSYTDYARISANTGLSTVIGWTAHEWLWRGTYDIPAPRIAEVKTLYETSDEKTAEKLIKKYHIKYVFIGNLEKEKYKLQEKKFSRLGHIVYQKDTTTIYEIR